MIFCLSATWYSVREENRKRKKECQQTNQIWHKFNRPENQSTSLAFNKILTSNHGVLHSVAHKSDDGHALEKGGDGTSVELLADAALDAVELLGVEGGGNQLSEGRDSRLQHFYRVESANWCKMFAAR